MSIVRLENVNKSFGPQHVLNDLNMEIQEGIITVIIGPSGSGKSTILNLVGLLDKPTSGKVMLFDEAAPKPFSGKATQLLRDKIGYLFQNFALVDNKSVEYNLKIALEHVKGNKSEMIKDVLEEVGLEGFEKKKVYQCSGGEQQRIAIARLLLKPCDLVLCDEPTGSLDVDNKHIIFDLLRKLKAQGKSVVVVTHDQDLVEIADAVLDLDEINNPQEDI